ncbi:uncharacterized protein [Narcine bancroftii]|uniref:uncharacterized protein isoform X3 n=1 Tax=Narcine bancroftii TaxID=1343680 RepID=UPI003831982B
MKEAAACGGIWPLRRGSMRSAGSPETLESEEPVAEMFLRFLVKSGLGKKDERHQVQAKVRGPLDPPQLMGASQWRASASCHTEPVSWKCPSQSPREQQVDTEQAGDSGRAAHHMCQLVVLLSGLCLSCQGLAAVCVFISDFQVLQHCFLCIYKLELEINLERWRRGNLHQTTWSLLSAIVIWTCDLTGGVLWA